MRLWSREARKVNPPPCSRARQQRPGRSTAELSRRGGPVVCDYHRVLKLARTVADLAGAEAIGAAHLAEALQYRPKEQA